jgi:hypothetical protein
VAVAPAVAAGLAAAAGGAGDAAALAASSPSFDVAAGDARGEDFDAVGEDFDALTAAGEVTAGAGGEGCKAPAPGDAGFAPGFAAGGTAGFAEGAAGAFPGNDVFGAGAFAGDFRAGVGAFAGDGAGTSQSESSAAALGCFAEMLTAGAGPPFGGPKPTSARVGLRAGGPFAGGAAPDAADTGAPSSVEVMTGGAGAFEMSCGSGARLAPGGKVGAGGISLIGMTKPHLRHFIRTERPVTFSSAIWYFALQLGQRNFIR